MDFSIVWHAVQSVLTLCCIGCVGYVLARKGWFTPEAKALLPRLVIQVALPVYMLYNITHSLSRDELLHLAYGVFVPVLSIGVMFCLSFALGRLLKVPHKRRGIFYSGCSVSNTIFIGLPVNLALFGEAALPYVLLYYFGNTVFFWTVGNYVMAADGEEKVRIFSLATLRRVFSPPMLGFITAVLLLLLGIPLPDFLLNTARILGNLTTPLIIMFIGIMLQGIRIRAIRPSRELLVILLCRFVVSPLMIVLITLFVPLPDLMRQVFVIQSALPTVAAVSLLSSYYRTDPEFGVLVVSATTLLSILTIPVTM
ncbi:AEC family transporter, partial [Desulfovibrio sp. OttesenSCG-928-A18]|nr:AEC family transporter [Desulfovibrio sp. OttesenSCG-928-A18]